jgi:hypothetical protein
MNHKEFFNVLIGNPPPSLLSSFLIKDYCCDLVKHVRLQDMLLMSAIIKISDTETRNYHLERELRQYRKLQKQGFLGKVRYVLFGNTTEK